MARSTILIATDFSAHAERAAEWGAAIARLLGADVELLAAFHFPPIVPAPGAAALPGDLFERAREGLREQLEERAGALREGGLRVSVCVRQDDPSVAICEHAEEISAELIAMGTRGLSGLRHVVLGSVAERTARTATCPVLTAHSDCPAPGAIRTILVPSDFSTHADAALAWATRLAASTKARVVLEHSYHVPRNLESSVVLTDQGVIDSIAEDVNSRLDRVKSDSGVDADFVLANGHADEAALEVARAQSADLIVIGTRGLTGLGHVLLGSTAERIIRRSAVPVVSLKGH